MPQKNVSAKLKNYHISIYGTYDPTTETANEPTSITVNMSEEISGHFENIERNLSVTLTSPDVKGELGILFNVPTTEKLLPKFLASVESLLRKKLTG